MKELKVRHLISLSLFMGLFASGCQWNMQPKEYKLGLKSVAQKQFSEAENHFFRMMMRDPSSPYALKASREGSRISMFETKNYAKAIDFFKHAVLYSKDSRERRDSQRKIAEIYFDHLSDYGKAIIEYQRLLDLPHSIQEEYEYRLNLARAHYYTNNFFQAESETNELLKMTLDNRRKFDVMLLKGNVLLSGKSSQSAITHFQEMMKTFPERAEKENLGLNLAVAYEDQKDFDSAIKVLTAMKDSSPDPQFIEIRIKRLMQRRANLPGGKGFKR